MFQSTSPTRPSQVFSSLTELQTADGLLPSSQQLEQQQQQQNFIYQQQQQQYQRQKINYQNPQLVPVQNSSLQIPQSQSYFQLQPISEQQRPPFQFQYPIGQQQQQRQQQFQQYHQTQHEIQVDPQFELQNQHQLPARLNNRQLPLIMQNVLPLQRAPDAVSIHQQQHTGLNTLEFMANERKSGLSVHSLIDQESQDTMDDEGNSTSRIPEYMESDGDADAEGGSSTVVGKNDEWQRQSPLDRTMLSPITEGSSSSISSNTAGFGVVLPPLSSIISVGVAATFSKSDGEIDIKEKR
ncbi:hypothetical protein HK100_010246, partial [Physocladia obscura]